MKNITIENFINTAIMDGEFSKLGDSKQVNKNYKNLESIKGYLLKNPDCFSIWKNVRFCWMCLAI